MALNSGSGWCVEIMEIVLCVCGQSANVGQALTWPMKVRMPKLAILMRVTDPVPTPLANSEGLRALAGSARKVERPLMMLLPSMMGLPRISTWLRILCISCRACAAQQAC